MQLLHAGGIRAVFLNNAVHHGVELFRFRAVNNIGILDANQRPVRGNHDDVEAVNLVEFFRLGLRGSGHAGKLFVHAEIILERDGGESLIFTLDFHAFFCFDGLVQTVGPAPAGHLAPSEFVDDDDFAFLDDVIDVAREERVRAQPLINVVDGFEVLRVVHIRQREQAFALGHAFFGQRGGLVLLVERVVNILDELGNDFVDAVIFVGRFFRGTGNNQRRARFVDQDRVHFVDDSEMMAALDAVGQVVLHVVAQIIETEFVVRSVGDIRAIGRAALRVVQIVNDDADGEAKRLIDRAHPFRVAPRQIIVHGDDMHAAAGERIQIRGQSGDESLAFAGFHLGDFAFMQHHAADELHVKMPHSQLAAAGFAREGKRGHEYFGKRGLHFGTVFRVVGARRLRVSTSPAFSSRRS